MLTFHPWSLISRNLCSSLNCQFPCRGTFLVIHLHLYLIQFRKMSGGSWMPYSCFFFLHFLFALNYIPLLFFYLWDQFFREDLEVLGVQFCLVRHFDCPVLKKKNNNVNKQDMILLLNRNKCTRAIFTFWAVLTPCAGVVYEQHYMILL